MLTADEVESLNCAIQAMDRAAVVERLRNFKARFPIDFTPEFFTREPLPRLRHILFGLCLHNQKTLTLPTVPSSMAA
ncbi:MAG TPA: hypothetical protein VF624_15130 [Tepidisphaeraceae bacterium]|jgi:hypothetical protein